MNTSSGFSPLGRAALIVWGILGICLMIYQIRRGKIWGHRLFHRNNHPIEFWFAAILGVGFWLCWIAVMLFWIG
jgi:hypothetical protein